MASRSWDDDEDNSGATGDAADVSFAKKLPVGFECRVNQS